MINVDTIIGSSIFIVPASIAVLFSGSFPTILVWIAGGLVSLCGALCVAELGAAMPKAGGQYVYLQRAFGPLGGYLYGWGTAVVINPASIAFVAVGFATYPEHRAGGVLSCAAVIVLRQREPALDRPYRTWGYPVTPLVFILFSGYLTVNTIREAPQDAAIGAALLLAGLPVYWYCRRRYGTRDPGTGGLHVR